MIKVKLKDKKEIREIFWMPEKTRNFYQNKKHHRWLYLFDI